MWQLCSKRRNQSEDYAREPPVCRLFVGLLAQGYWQVPGLEVAKFSKSFDYCRGYAGFSHSHALFLQPNCYNNKQNLYLKQ